MSNEQAEFIRVGTLDQLREARCIVVRGADHPIAVFHHDGAVHAVDNRCPHLGFPLSRGSVDDGILTCHWHHARFDLTSGCTFDLFADDVPAADVQIRGDEVWVASRCREGDARGRLQRRLNDGMKQDVRSVIAKAVVALLRKDRSHQDIVRVGILFGVKNRDDWSAGSTILTAMANLVPDLAAEEQYLALYRGLVAVADATARQSPRREGRPLDGTEATTEMLHRWLNQWVLARHRDGAERTLLTAISKGESPAALAHLLMSVATQRMYADGGHVLDFVNKSLESLDLIGWEHAATVLPSIVRHLTSGRGGEESNAWRQPIDLVALCEEALVQLPGWRQAGKGKKWTGESDLAQQLLVDDPCKVITALSDAITRGARPTQLCKSLCLAAATRIARFGTANEFSDWDTALHTFTYSNAIHQALRRLEAAGHEVSADVLRGVFHGAMSVYLDRFLNVPPAAIPGEKRGELDDQPTDAAGLREQLLDTLNTQKRVNAAARLVARYLDLGHPAAPLIQTLAKGVLREDAAFHDFQMLEASIQQFKEWGMGPQGRLILIAQARYLAAHAPTQRSELQTADIAMRLDRGDALHEEA